MSIGHRRTKLVLSIVEDLTGQGKTLIRPGDVSSLLRERNQPLSFWEIRGELSNLESAGLVTLDAASGAWQLATAAVARKAG